jgi:amino acid permease
MSWVKWVAVVAFVVTGVVMFIYSFRLLDMAEKDEPTRRRYVRRMLRWVGLWQLSVALVLFSINGWHSLPSMISLIGVGLLVSCLPQLLDSTNRRP